LGYEKPVSTDAKAKILIGSFLPFSTASVSSDWFTMVPRCRLYRRWRQNRCVRAPEFEPETAETLRVVNVKAPEVTVRRDYFAQS
jgi:hypothetical protein